MMKMKYKQYTNFVLLVSLFLVFKTVSYFRGNETGTSLLLYFGLVVFIAIAFVVCKKIFKVQTSGDMPWYGSPLLWVGLPAFGIILYGLL